MQKISITCTTNDSLALSALTPLQGNLKKLSDSSKKKLRTSILKNGFAFPFFVWWNKKNKVNYILDGHGRRETLQEMEKEGYVLPAFPVVYIEATNLDDAKAKLLAISSQYGKFTEKGVKEFIDSFDFAPDAGLFDSIDVPFTDFAGLDKPDPELVDVSSHKRELKGEETKVTDYCPECGVILTDKKFVKS